MRWHRASADEGQNPDELIRFEDYDRNLYVFICFPKWIPWAFCFYDEKDELEFREPGRKSPKVFLVTIIERAMCVSALMKPYNNTA